MIRSTGLLLCLLAVVLISSAAHATLIWTPPIVLSGGWANMPTMSDEFYIPSYVPEMYGGADLQAVRFDLWTNVENIEFGVANSTENSVYGLLTVAGSFQAFDPTTPGRIFAETHHEWSQFMAVPPMNYSYGQIGDFPRSDFGMVTTNLDQFASSTLSPVAFGLRSFDQSSWTGPEDVSLLHYMYGVANLSIYYGYDDGTPARTPEPNTLLLMAAGLPALRFLKRKRRQP